MTEMKKCFAFNGDGLRCMALAGHDGPHAHAIEWTDEECWEPGAIPVIGAGTVHIGKTEIVYTNDVVAEVTHGSGICGICEHPHHPGGVCGADDHGYDCDCSNSVED
jgi:hypothetical protein